MGYLLVFAYEEKWYKLYLSYNVMKISCPLMIILVHDLPTSTNVVEKYTIFRKKKIANSDTVCTSQIEFPIQYCFIFSYNALN